ERFGLDARAVGRVRQVRRDARGDAPAPPDEPCLPDPRRIDGELCRREPAAALLDPPQPALAELDDAGLDREVAVEIAEPADAHAGGVEIIDVCGERLLG